MKKNKFLLLVLLIITFLFYLPVLKFYFISDDFYFLSFSNIKEVIPYKSGFYHYNPIFWLILFSIKKIFNLNTMALHSIVLSIHLVNVILLYNLAVYILKKRKQAIISSLLFAFFFGNYEVVYWITGLNTSLMVMFYLLSLIFFVKFIQTKNISQYILFFSAFTAALLTHEYSISLFPLCIICWFLLSRKTGNFISYIKVFLLPALVLLLLFLTKNVFSRTSFFVINPNLTIFMRSFIKSFVYMFIPNPFFIDMLPKFVLIPFFVIILIFILYNALSDKKRLFLFSWIFLTVAAFSLTSLPQARYFYLSFIPASITITSLLSLKINKIISFLYLFFIFSSGILFLYKQSLYWSDSSKITLNTLQKIKTLYPRPVSNKTVDFINLPDSVNGPPWNAYLFRNGFENALNMYYGMSFSPIRYYRTVPYDEVVRNDPFISQQQLMDLKKSGDVIFLYSKDTQTVNIY